MLVLSLAPVVAQAAGAGVVATSVTSAPSVFREEMVDETAHAHREALQAMQRGDYAEAYCLWRPLARVGDAQAQYSLGWMYHNGYGLAIDDHEALRWWHGAAEQGHLDSLFSLGALYSLGSAQIEQDLPKTWRYLLEAASQGHQDSRILLRELAALGTPELQEPVEQLIAGNWTVLGEPLEVKVDRANVRQGPGTEHRIVTVLERGQAVVELLRQEDWVKVGVAGHPRVAWIYAPLIGERERLAAEEH